MKMMPILIIIVTFSFDSQILNKLWITWNKIPWYPKWHKYSWLQRQSRFDQQGGGGGGFDGGFGNRGPGGMGGQSPMGGQGMPSQSPLFSGAGGGQGGMGNRGGNMDRRREGGPNRDDFDNKRMRRY